MEQKIRNKALELGFDLVGITDASPISEQHIAYFKNWIAQGFCGQMAYMHRNFDKRTNPGLLMNSAKSIVCVGLNYKAAHTGIPARPNHGLVASYACFEDYHEFIKQRLYLLADFIKPLAAGSLKFKVCVDSAPLAERLIAARAGLGFIAKNRMLTHPVLGQQIFLGELIVNLELKPAKPFASKCSGCNKCIKACPTGALTEKGLDARRCISYLTIEHKSSIPNELAAKVGNRFFGCDQCILACPCNLNAPTASNKDFKFYKDRQLIDLHQIIKMDESEFKNIFSNSPIFRLGSERAKRNAALCLANNQGATKLSPAVVGVSIP